MQPLAPFRRLNYFFGRLLSVADLQNEQAYFRRKSQLQNRLLLGIGVVDGLQVAVSGNELVVQPGLAYDCQGNELVLAQERRHPLPSEPGQHFLCIRYTERLVDPVPVVEVSPMPEGPEPQATCVEEGVELLLARSVQHRRQPLPSERITGCERGHPMGLARISRRGHGWSVRSLALRVRLPR